MSEKCARQSEFAASLPQAERTGTGNGLGEPARHPSGIFSASAFRKARIPAQPPPPKLSSRFGADAGIARQGTSVRRISSKSTRPTAKGPNPTLGYRRSESGGMENTYR